MTAIRRGGFLISQIKQIQGRVFERLLKAAAIDDFNGAQGRILFVLWQQDDVPIVELSRKTGLAKTTLTSMLERLEKQGHINRRQDGQNRRQVRITLSEKAKNLSERYEEVSAQMIEVFYRGFSDEEMTHFEGFLERVLANLSESEKCDGSVSKGGDRRPDRQDEEHLRLVRRSRRLSQHQSDACP